MQNESAPDGTIKSGAQLLTVVELLQTHDGLGVSELAALIGRSKGSAHRYLKTLAEHGYAVRRGDEYHLSLRFLDHGIYVQRNTELYQAAKSKVDLLAREVDERAWCLVEENGVGVFIYGSVGDNAVATDARVGRRMPLHCTSGGKAILAFSPDSLVDQVLEGGDLEQFTDHTIASPERLREELATIADRGYSLNLEESITGLHAVGAPILDDGGDVRGALSVAGAAHRMSERRCKTEISDLVFAASNEVELDMRYGRGPD